jgi:hypothetical protein
LDPPEKERYMKDKYTEIKHAVPVEPLPHECSPPAADNPHQLATRGLAAMFELHPAVAFGTVACDLGLHGADVVSAGLLIPFSALAGVVLGVIAYRSQKRFCGDDHESALVKGLIVGLLTAIPSPLPYVLFIPAGLLGWVKGRRR